MVQGFSGRANQHQARSPLARLQASIRDGIEAHDFPLAQRGKEYLNRVGEFVWNEDQSAVMCEVQGSAGSPYAVTIECSRDDLEFFDAYCTCPYSDELGPCKHTYAALRKLDRRLADARDPLLQQLFGIGGSSESWKAALQTIDRFVDLQQKRHAASTPDMTRRVVWRIDYRVSGYGAKLTITPIEQKRTKAGKWSAGRKLQWQRFVEDPGLLTTDFERRIVDLFKSVYQSEYGGYYYQEPESLLLITKLIGHPFVYWADGTPEPIEVVAATIGLAVVPHKKGYELQASLNGDAIDPKTPTLILENRTHRGVLQFKREENRLLVAECEPEMLELVRSLSQLNTVVPKAEKESLLARVAKIEVVLPVKLPSDLMGGSIEPDRRSFLRLTPRAEGGVKAELRVRPAPGGMLLEPGSGPPELTSVADNRRVLVTRQLEEEKAQALRLAGELGLEGQIQPSAWDWLLYHDDDALDLVSAAQDRLAAGGEDLVVLWPDGVGMTVSRAVTSQSLRVEIDDRKDWFGLSGTIDVDGEQVPLATLLAGIKSGARYVAVGKQKWIRIAQAFRDRLAALGDVVHQSRAGLEIDATAAPLIADLIDDQAAIESCRRWRDVIRRLDDASELSPDPPKRLTADLRPYQVEGYRWLRRLAEWGVGGCLADDMGLGKTVQTLALLLDRSEIGPALVVAPTSVGFNWVREAERFAATLRATLYRETDRGEFLSSLGPRDLVVISYGLLQRDADKLAAVRWGTLVLDEAQKIKNSQTKTAKAVREMTADWRLALTGTPVENHLGELWSIFRAISPGLFGSWERFRDRFAEPIERRKDAGRRHALARLVRPFILRRTKSEVLSELPDRTEMLRTAELSPRERKMYEDVRLAAVAKLAGLDEATKGRDPRFEVLAALTRLRQLACHPRLVDASWTESSAKLDALLEIVDELIEGNHRALVFSQFTQHLALIREALDARGIEYRYLDGATPAKQRMAEVDAFQAGSGQLFLISLKAGGTGLNLTAADYVIHMDPWWNPAVEDQATDRAHRIGQSRPVTVCRLVTKDTIEEQILSLHADKRQLVAGVLDGTDQAGKLSTEELVSMIRTGGQSQPAEPAPAPAKKRLPVPKTSQRKPARKTRAKSK